jgi:hypothetical protein
MDSGPLTHKLPRLETDHLHIVLMLKMNGAIPQFTSMSSCNGAKLRQRKLYLSSNYDNSMLNVFEDMKSTGGNDCYYMFPFFKDQKC